MYVYTCIAHMHAHIHKGRYIHMYTHTHAWVCTHVYICTCPHMCIYIYIYMNTRIHTSISTHIYTFIYMLIHTYTHACSHTYIHTCIKHTCMHTHTHKHTTHLSFSCGAPRGGRGSDHRNTGAAIIYSRKTPGVKVLIDPFAPRVRKGWTLLHWTLRPFSLFKWVSPCQSAPAVLLSISYTDTLLSLKPSGRLGRSQLD